MEYLLKLKMLYINLSIENHDTLHELLKMSETISYKPIHVQDKEQNVQVSRKPFLSFFQLREWIE